jgi:hypothetical protein
MLLILVLPADIQVCKNGLFWSYPLGRTPHTGKDHAAAVNWTAPYVNSAACDHDFHDQWVSTTFYRSF